MITDSGILDKKRWGSLEARLRSLLVRGSREQQTIYCKITPIQYFICLLIRLFGHVKYMNIKTKSPNGLSRACTNKDDWCPRDRICPGRNVTKLHGLGQCNTRGGKVWTNGNIEDNLYKRILRNLHGSFRKTQERDCITSKPCI